MCTLTFNFDKGAFLEWSCSGWNRPLEVCPPVQHVAEVQTTASAAARRHFPTRVLVTGRRAVGPQGAGKVDRPLRALRTARQPRCFGAVARRSREPRRCSPSAGCSPGPWCCVPGDTSAGVTVPREGSRFSSAAPGLGVCQAAVTKRLDGRGRGGAAPAAK